MGKTAMDTYRRDQNKIAELQAQLDDKQFRIDNLMLEYCPDEMTDEQIKEWEKHQVPAGDKK